MVKTYLHINNFREFKWRHIVKTMAILFIFYGNTEIINLLKTWAMFYLFYGIQDDFIEKYLLLINLFSFLNLLIVFEVVALRRKIIG